VLNKLFFLFILAILLINCGVKGPPLPPEKEVLPEESTSQTSQKNKK
jgi:predicted small lipoprotein YifL